MMFLGSCVRGAEETPLDPPPTNPLARTYLGYGVINVSFTHVYGEAGQDGLSLGYLRRGSLVKIIERRPVTNQSGTELWILVSADTNIETALTPSRRKVDSGESNPLTNQDASGGEIRGWLRETTADVYDNEDRARTASGAMAP
jgi:hypothetical protein